MENDSDISEKRLNMKREKYAQRKQQKQKRGSDQRRRRRCKTNMK